MFQILSSNGLDIDDLAEYHWERLIQKKDNYSKGSLPYEMGSIIRRVEKIHTLSTGKRKTFTTDLRKNNYDLLRKIITGTPSDLTKIGNRIFKKIKQGIYPQITYRNNKKERKKFGDYIHDIFNYDSFSVKAKDWGAYELAKCMGVNVCAYCNRNFIFTILDKDKKIVRPEFDHFMPISHFPFFALSLYNMIPSCHICNSNLKGDKIFTNSTNLNPFMHSFDRTMRFTIVFNKRGKYSANEIMHFYGIMFFMDTIDNFEIRLVKRDRTVSNSLFKKAKSNAKVFRIIELYNCHKDMVSEMVRDKIVYSEERIRELLISFGGLLFDSRDDVIRHITKNYVLDDQMSMRPFSKLSRDIHREFGLK